MKTKLPSSTTDAARRQRAEAALSKQQTEAEPARTKADTQRLVHELQVHQLELEMQNEELQRARDEMEAGLEKYSDLYDFAPVGYVTLDRVGDICEINLTCASLLGIERSRLVERRFGLFVNAGDLPSFGDFMKKVFATTTREFCEVSLLKEGRPPVEVRMEAVMAASGRECRVAVTDITERKRAEADRLILSKLESTGVLAGGIAHDFNNLLTTILMNIEIARMPAQFGDELKDYLGEAKKAVLLARGLTQQLITFAVGGAPLRKPTVLTTVIQESARLALGGSRVQGQFAIADDLWPAEVEAGQIGQVIRNIVQNAAEAMPEGGGLAIRAENRVLGAHDDVALPPGHYVCISIADRGGGIAAEVLPKIFDPYFSTRQRGVQNGMGLGLTVCHSVMQKHGGAITVESESGVGTTFHLYLPAARKPIVAAKAEAPKPPSWWGRILVMDDEENVRKVIGTTLRRMGHEVELAEDGQKAIELYRSARDLGRPFDLVILDLTVRAGLGGQETIRELLRFDSAVKAILMSGYADAAAVLDCEDHGFKGSLAKPFDAEKLQQTISRVMKS